MIIVDDNDAHARKAAQQRRQAVGQASSESTSPSSTAPADVETGYVPESDAPPPYEASSLLQTHQDVKIRTRRRFLHACFAGIVVYVLFGIIIGFITQDSGSDEVRRTFVHKSRTKLSTLTSFVGPSSNPISPVGPSRGAEPFSLHPCGPVGME